MVMVGTARGQVPRGSEAEMGLGRNEKSLKSSRQFSLKGRTHLDFRNFSDLEF